MLHQKLIDLEKKFRQSPITQLFDPLLEQKKVELWVKRDDLIHSVISGNKWRKLKFILDHALKINSHTIISMGGAYSNHLHALAYVGKQLNLQTKAYVRGGQPEILNPTLLDLQNWGMELRFISRSEFRELRKYKKHNDFPVLGKGEYWLPEGGATKLALQGIAELASEIDSDFDTICLPCGTGTTLAGIVKSTQNQSIVYGFSALKGTDFLSKDIEAFLNKGISNKVNWTIQLDYHFGGFAKTNNELLLFIMNFEKQHTIELEPVYTGKMFYGLFDLIKQDVFNQGQKIIAIHTGGLQGNRGMEKA